MDHRLNADALASMVRIVNKLRVDSLNVDSLNAAALPNVDGRRLDHRLRVDRQRKLNELTVAVAVVNDNSKQRHKVNV